MLDNQKGICYGSVTLDFSRRDLASGPAAWRVVTSPFCASSRHPKSQSTKGLKMDFPNLIELVDKGYALKGVKKWPTYLGGRLDRRGYVSSSEIGNCRRRIKYGKMRKGTGQLARWGYAERGNIIEAWAVDLIRAALEKEHPGWRLMFAGENQFSFVDDVQSGTPDGLLVHMETHRGLCLDIKSVDPRTNYDRLPKVKHKAQVHQNIDLMNHLTPYDVVGGLLLYIDASDLQKRKLFEIEYDATVMDALHNKAREIMDAEKPEDLPADGVFMDKECGECEFSELCSAHIERTQIEAKAMQEHERAMQNVFKS